MNAPARIRRSETGQFMGGLHKDAARRRQVEGRMQEAFTDWCRFCLPESVLWFSVPNERQSSPANTARLKRQGLLPGAADFVLVHQGRAFFIEFKAKRGVQSDNQREFMRACGDAGAPYAIARSSAEAVSIARSWGIPSREKKQ